MNTTRLRKDLMRHEGSVVKNGRHQVYVCPAGKQTIGYGRNLERGLSQAEAEYLLSADIADSILEAQKAFPWFKDLNASRQEAVVNMLFNLGLARMLKFRKMIAAFARGDYEVAAREAQDSLWFRQVGLRGREIVDMIRTGKHKEELS